MKQSFILVLLVGSFYLSSAETTNDEYRHEENRIISISQTSTKKAINTKKLKLDDDIIQNLLKSTKEAQNEEGTIDFNDMADYIIDTIANELLMGEGDPANLDDHEITFEYRPLLITYTGTLKLTKGFIQELSTVSRRDSAVLTYPLPPSYFTVYIPLGFKNIVAGYNFEMNVRGDTVTGVLYAWVDGLTADYNAEVSLATMTTISKEFALNRRSLSIDVYSASISNAYKNLVKDLTENLMQDTVYERTDAIVGDTLNTAVLSIFGTK